MDYLSAEEGLQALLAQHMPLSRSQSGRIALLCGAVVLAGEVHLTKIARFLAGNSQQDSRVRWIVRLLRAPFMSQERVYQPILNYALHYFRDHRWHLVIDRTTLWHGKVDLATISLNYHKHAVPLVGCCLPFGGADEPTYLALLRRCVGLIPPSVAVVFHGDTEFGSAGIVRSLREVGWDFVLGQPSSTHFRRHGEAHSQALATLPVTRRRACQVANVELFASHRLGAINRLAFYQPHYTQCGQRKREVCYLATSLPLNAGVKRLGRRRWGTEPFCRDYKSSGWRVTQSQLTQIERREGLLIVLALAYLWAVCVGCWLCKTGQRRQIDSKLCRHLSLFRLGWDWLVHRLRCDLPCPSLLRLYI